MPIQIEEMMAIKNKHSLLKCKIAVFILSIYILTVNIKHKSGNALYNIFLISNNVIILLIISKNIVEK